MGWRRLRDRWLGDPAVRTRVARWPLGGFVSRHHARRLFATVAGFVPAQMLAAAVELGVFERLRDGPRAWEGITDLPPTGAAALRQALSASGLIEERRGLVALTIDGLVIASDTGLRAMIAHHRLLYADLTDPVAMLRGGSAGQVAGFWPYEGGGDPAGFSALMTASTAMVADALIDHPLFDSAGHVMDIGGGHGAFLRALRRRHPALSLTLVDLPTVVAALDMAAERIDVRGCEPGAPLPRGADTITLVRVLHDLDDKGAAVLLARAAAALPVGGRVIVAEPMALVKRDPQTAYFAAYFAAMRSGRLRKPDEVLALLHAAGLRQTGCRPTGPLMHVAHGYKGVSLC